MPIQQAVHAFINERLQAKLDGAKSQQEIDELTEKYHPHRWIADAAKRATQIQFATHTVKGVHPDSKGTNFNAQLSTLPSGLVGTGSLKSYKLDVVGNAAALDVYKFLSVMIDEQTSILDLVLREDEQLLSILASNRQEAECHLSAFKSITLSSSNSAKTYELMKQLLWPVGDRAQADDSYVNIVPLYPTSLVHQVYHSLQDIRFGEKKKLAKEAHRKQENHPDGYMDLPNVAYIKLGGTKPQNVSQLNSERGGRHYLLPSSPPKYSYRDVRAPLYERSIFTRVFPYFAKQDIQRFCQDVIDQTNNTYEVREKRRLIIEDIINTLIVYGSKVRDLEGGWSTKASDLDSAQAFWLDPKRAEIDAEWAELRNQSDWKMDLAHSFALWLNLQLNEVYRDNKEVYLADAEYREWKSIMVETIQQYIREGWGVFE